MATHKFAHVSMHTATPINVPESYPVFPASRRLTVVAWVVTISVSTLPDIGFHHWSKVSFASLIAAKVGLLLVLAALALVWKPLRPLRNFFVVLSMMLALNELRPQVNFTAPAMQRAFGASAFDARMQAEQTAKLAVSIGMIVVLLALGYSRRDFFLVRGNLRAVIEPVRVLGFPKRESWASFGLQWGCYIATGLAVVQYWGTTPSRSVMVRVLPLLPSVLFYAALNAFNEEMTYRAPMLATLEPVGGSKQALWMSAYFFGIAHYFGTPGGLGGGIASIFMGWILGKAMLETRGLFWSWWIHFLSDVAIFFFLAATLLR